MPNQIKKAQFNNAVRKFIELINQHGEDSEIVAEYFENAVLKVMPENIKQDILKQAQSEGLLPKATAFTDDGEPLFSSKDVAERLGISEDEVIESINKRNYPLYTGKVHFKQ